MRGVIVLAAALLTAAPASARPRVAASQGPVFANGVWSFPMAAPAGTVIEHRHAARGSHRRAARLARHIRRDPGLTHAAPSGVAANGLVAPLAAKVAEIAQTCGSHLISAVRHTLVAGTRRISLHAYGEAADVSGNPGCIYNLLHGWPGGYSVDYGAVQHVHISYEPHGREWGARFVHHAALHRRRHHHHHRRHAWA